LCLGLVTETIPAKLCHECPVRYQCIWIALTEDDRLGESTFFIRGGLSANKRQEIWAKNGHNPEKAFSTSVVEMERAKCSEQAKQSKQKGNRNK